MSNCHCGNDLSFESCCMPIIKNLSIAKTAEQVMRARYSSYVTSSIDFLRDSHIPIVNLNLNMKKLNLGLKIQNGMD